MDRSGSSRLALGLALALAGCQASVAAEAESGGTLDADVESSSADPIPAAGADDERQTLLATAGRDPGETALLGARHDLGLREPAKNVSCTCLAVAIGPASSPMFSWRTTPPNVDPTTQWVIALESDSVSCPDAPTGTAPASYWGYRVQGDDVVVVVEKAKPGRPVTRGAIIPRPTGSGNVYVTPVDATVPYGRGEDGARCQLTPLGAG